jgi:hypothetical protein
VIDSVWTLTAGTAARGSTRSEAFVFAAIDLEIKPTAMGQHVSGITIACVWQHSQAFHPDGN